MAKSVRSRVWGGYILTAWSVDNGQIWSEICGRPFGPKAVDPVGCGCILLHWSLAMNTAEADKIHTAPMALAH